MLTDTDKQELTREDMLADVRLDEQREQEIRRLLDKKQYVGLDKWEEELLTEYLGEEQEEELMDILQYVLEDR